MRRKDINMLEGSIVKGLLAMAIPIMIANVIQSMYNIVDMRVLKQFDPGDGLAIGAVSACGTLTNLITALVIGISTGSNVIVARYIGRKDPESRDRAIHTALAFSIAAGLLLTLIGIIGAPYFLVWTNCDPELLPGAILYFRMYFAGVVVLFLHNFCASFLRATGDSRRLMSTSLTGGAVKVAGTFLFVGGFKMGILGVSLATLVSWFVYVALDLRVLLPKNRAAVRIRPRDIRFHKKEMKEILHVGIPAGLQQALYSVANVIIVSTVNTFGKEATTGLGIANQYDNILYQICTAVTLSVMPYVSQNIGAGNVTRAKQAMLRGFFVTATIAGTLGTISAICSRQLAGFMSSNPQVIEYAHQKMVIISCTYFLCGTDRIIGQSLRAMGKPMAATVSTMVWMCAFRFFWVYVVYYQLIPSYNAHLLQINAYLPFTLPPISQNLTSLYLVWPIGWLLSICTLLCIFFPTVKKLSKKAAVGNAI